MSEFNEIYVNSAQVVLFHKSVSALDKQNILHSSLFAQLVANKAAKATVSEWQHQYDSGIARSHWLQVSSGTEHITWPHQPSTLRSLVGQMLANQPQKQALLAAIDQLSHPLNAKAMSVLHAAVSKPSAEAKQQGLCLQVMVVRSAVDICAHSLMVEGSKCPAGAHWLQDKLPSKPATEKFSVLTSRYQLRPDYATIRARVEAAVGKWPEKLTVAIMIATDEVDTGLLPKPPQAPTSY